MNESEFAELAAGHSLGALSARDEERFRAALAERPEWTTIADDDADTASLLAEGVPAVPPPPGIRDALLARIAVTTQEPEDAAEPVVPAGPEKAPPAPAAAGAGSGARDDARSPRRPRRLLFGLAAGLVLLIGLGVGAAVVIPQLLRPAAVVALDRIENAPDAAEKTVQLPEGGTATAHWSASMGAAVLVADGLGRLDAAKTYELWFVRGSTPVSAGVFEAAQGVTTAQLKGAMHAGDAIAVTIEPAGGSPTGKPTSEPILVIPTS
ncbi:MAG: anti-sigma factor [Microbacterium sp.]|jgi:anti-sigma-K factor RskA|uniref:anti-sigma factor n=1 Tax=Microbacterium sp. TaxID=51671 RepID=UPI002833F477|nr:anti-sigma factor [Microbacterium sp.]MDR2322503.1 anti-sigma factor [Microbacterium sp.]